MCRLPGSRLVIVQEFTAVSRLTVCVASALKALGNGLLARCPNQMPSRRLGRRALPPAEVAEEVRLQQSEQDALFVIARTNSIHEVSIERFERIRSSQANRSPPEQVMQDKVMIEPQTGAHRRSFLGELAALSCAGRPAAAALDTFAMFEQTASRARHG